jgi:hypothetical protein
MTTAGGVATGPPELPGNDDGRPPAGPATTEEPPSSTTSVHSLAAHGCNEGVRCQRCRRPLRAVVSVSLRTGPVCQRKLRAVAA